jgi:hypothetical protein
MSDTIIDDPKITQMLGAGWQVKLWKNPLGSYTAEAYHDKQDVWRRARDKWLRMAGPGNEWIVHEDWSTELIVTTDDFTPSQALTRLAYKVHGELPPEETSE